MKPNNRSVVPRVRDGERGQAIVMVPLLLALLLAVAALAIDMGNLYWSYQEIQSATQAAALAGGQAIVTNNNAVTAAQYYSGAPSSLYNYYPNLNQVSPVTVIPTMGCINPTTYPNYGLPPCATYGPNTGNSIKVTETAVVSTFFARIFGVPTIPISATAVASATGGAAGSWNVAIIVDTTPSMGTADTNCGLTGNVTRLQCALNGIQVLLKILAPCPVGQTCSSTNASDRVALFTFPNVTVGTVQDDYTCTKGKSTNPTAVVYSFPSTTATSYSPPTSPTTTPTYQVTGYLNDYQGTTPATPPALSGGSEIVESVGAGSCAGMGIPNLEYTYYAGVIYAAQASLVSEQALNPGSQNAMILLSDGDATATKVNMDSTATNSGTYPSYVDECGQAVTAAQAAAAAGTRVYSVAYGSASSGCVYDTSGFSKGITPCQTMEGIAGGAGSTYFYSDYNQSGTLSTCQSASQHVTSLNDIFLSIGESLTGSRLVPPIVAAGFQ